MENAPETDSKEQPVTDEAPARISALSQETVNKIAAGEVVVRPANVVKELLENSLDAGATEIIITAKKGGMELIQIQDNGKGIHADDLPIVCERFTTSKLKSYEELKEISTFGFRGEALASVSYCAHLCIKSKTKADVCANMAKYKDSRIVGTVTRSAATQGTTITVESLFYNNPARRRAMKSAADEMNKISDVITQYAINYPKVSFSFRRCGNGTDFRTTGNGYKADVVCSLMGKKIGRELIELDHNSYHLKFTMEGCMAKPSAQCTAYGLQDRQNRHKAFHLFINGRSVECPALKQMMDTCFAGKQVSCPFLFLSLTIAPERVDVNVHPAKKTVFFLDQERIIDSIDEYIASIIDQVFGDQDLDSGSYLSTLTTSSQIVSEKKSEPSSKSTTSKQLKLTFHERPRSVSPARSEDLFNDSAGSVVFNMSAPKTPVYAHHLVRTDAGERSLSEFQPSSADTSRDFNVSDVCVSQFSTDDEEEETESMEEKSVGDKEIEATQSFREIDLDSVRELRKEICEASSDTLREMFKQMAVVGPVDAQYAMVQFSTAMYKIDINVIAREFFYQSIIFSLGNLGSFKLNNVDSNLLAITEVLQLVGEDMRPTDEDSKEAAQYLLSQSEMLWDYFSIAIEEEDDGSIIIEALPSIIDGYVPALEGLPNFIMNLLMKVDWGDEKACIEGIARCLADFFTATILILKELEDDETEAQEEEMPEASEGEAVEESLLIDNDEDFEEEEVKPVPESPWKKLVCHYLIPACKAKLIPPESFKAEEEGVIMRVVDLHDLYKVFERC